MRATRRRNAPRAARRPPWPIRVVRARARLFVCAGIGVATSAALAAVTTWRPATRVLVAWDVSVGLYLILALVAMVRADVHRIRARAAEEDEGATAILIGTVIAAMASLAAIVAELGSASGEGGKGLHAGQLVAAATIFLSWGFIHTIFALHYAHEFYGPESEGGLTFPGGDAEPDYWDFMYFSFVIGMTCQVSDVGVTTRLVRRTVTAHAVVAFVFNTALLALSINLAASALQSGS
jgi:uncharacterized membrane protein